MSRPQSRRCFLATAGCGGLALALPSVLLGGGSPRPRRMRLAAGWQRPPREFSLCPFWFWNDALSEAELERQLAEFQRHGVHAFVIHPRAGLPRDTGWLSERMLHFLRFAVQRAAARDMWVVLYDEGMYPSGSSSGQVVAANPAYRTRGLFALDLQTATPGSVVQGVRIDAAGAPALAPDQHLVAMVRRRANGHRLAIIDRPMAPRHSLIRGLHFVEDDPPRRADHKEVPENLPPAADILNPAAVRCFIRLVYQRFFAELGRYFGKTVRAIFTDEPSFLAKSPEPGAVAGTTGILAEVNRLLGRDFTDALPVLWHADEPDAGRHRKDYYRALQARLEETFYRPISTWCQAHGVALTGHPAAPDDLGHLRYFQIPGQDIVWRYLEPGKPSALEGPQSTQAKGAASAALHLGRRRNANEYCGAYGHDFTFDELQWLTGWLVVRGCNLLYPHAFYYSVRGPRIDERPPDVGPHSVWWDQYPAFARAVQRLCWLNTDSRPVCELAILGANDWLPWEAAKVCFRQQQDFHYLEARHLWEDARVHADGIRLRRARYRALIVQEEPPPQARPALERLAAAGRVIRWLPAEGDATLMQQIRALVPADLQATPPASGLRVRHVVKDGIHYYTLFNEGEVDLSFTARVAAGGGRSLLDPYTDEAIPLETDQPIGLPRHQIRVLMTGGTKTSP